MRRVFQNNLILVFVSIIAIIFLAFLLRKKTHKPLEGIFHSVAEAPARFFSAIGFWAGDKFSFVGSISELKNQNEQLFDENLKLKSSLAQLKDVKQENDALREQIKLAPREKYNLEAAMVIGKEMSGLTDSIYIDKGSKDGLSEGMAVVAGEGVLVGKIIKTNPSDSLVQLILNRESRINAEIEESQEKGIVRGEYGTSAILDMIPQTVEVKPGDAVITSGLGSSLPRGLLIGYIKETVLTADQLFQRASLVLPVKPEKLRIVWVVR